MSMTQFLQQHGTDEDRAVWNSAVKVERQARIQRVRKLLVNVADPDQRKRLATNLMKESLEQLDDRLALLPPAPSIHNYEREDVDQFAANYTGAAGGAEFVTTNAQSSTDPELVLELPTMNWNEKEE